MIGNKKTPALSTGVSAYKILNLLLLLAFILFLLIFLLVFFLSHCTSAVLPGLDYVGIVTELYMRAITLVNR